MSHTENINQVVFDLFEQQPFAENSGGLAQRL